jgi:hypothetical protein
MLLRSLLIRYVFICFVCITNQVVNILQEHTNTRGEYTATLKRVSITLLTALAGSTVPGRAWWKGEH